MQAELAASAPLGGCLTCDRTRQLLGAADMPGDGIPDELSNVLTTPGSGGVGGGFTFDHHTPSTPGPQISTSAWALCVSSHVWMSWCAKFESRVAYRRATVGQPAAEGHRGAGSTRFNTGRFRRQGPAAGMDQAGRTWIYY